MLPRVMIRFYSLNILELDYLLSMLEYCHLFLNVVLLLFRYVRPADQETTANEKIACYSPFPRGEGTPCYAKAKEAPESVMRQKQPGERMGRSFIVVCWKSKAGLAGLRLVYSNHLRGFWV